MHRALNILIKPWSWRWQAKLALLLVVGAALWAWPHAWAWQQRRLGAAALDLYHAEEARAHLDACLKTWPNDPQALLLASRAARGTGAYDEAEQHLRACERLLPQDRAVVLEWSLLRAAKGTFDAPVEEFLLQHVEREPALAPLIWEALIQGYSRVYRAKEAYLLTERWLQRDPENVQALYLRAEVHQKMRRLQKAVPDYQRVVDLDPERNDARKWLARGLIEAGHYAEAAQHLDQLRRRTPDDADIVVLEARARKGLGQVPHARTLLDALLAKQPDHASALRVRGEIELAERPAEAETWLRKAAQLAPFDYLPHFLLLQALNRQPGKEAEAKVLHATVEDLKERDARLGELISGKLASRPRDPALHVEMGKLLLSLGHDEVGRGWLQSAVQIDPDFRPAHAALADHYKKIGNDEQAEYHRQQAGP